MTYLEIINSVLRRLREDTVAASNTSDYSKLIAEFVNQALYECEHAWDWTQLRDVITITTVASTADYDFHTDDTKIISAINETKDWYMRVIPAHWKHSHDYLIELTNDSPYYYSFGGTNGTYNQVSLIPTPDAVESIRFLVIKYSAQKAIDSSDDSDEIEIPELPVILKAYALAVRERGEDGGMSYNEAEAQAASVLADAISMDSSKTHFSEVSWCAI